MRDFLIVLLVFGSVPFTLVRPQVGIIMWFWIGLMNPHRLAWGYAQQLRVALIVGIATLLGWLISSERKRPPNLFIMYALAALTLWVSLSAFFAIHPEDSIPKWEEIIKILLMTFVTACIVNSRPRIEQLVWVIVVSIGFYGVKGGIFTIVTGGHNHVFGPADSFIADNNTLALAENMVLPLMQYLRVTSTRRVVRHGLTGMMGLTVISILGSYSRGGFLGLGVSMGYLWLKSKHRIGVALVAVTVLGVGLTLMPQEWLQRMQTVESYQDDASAEGRFDAWKFNFLLALDHPLVGGGQMIGQTDQQLFDHYVPGKLSRAAHSIYFEVLGETGFVGFAIYLALLISSFRTCRRIMRLARGDPQLIWARDLAAMMQVALIAYAVTGAFLSLGFYDLYYALVAVIAVTYDLVRRTVRATSVSAEFALGSGHPAQLRPAPAMVGA